MNSLLFFLDFSLKYWILLVFYSNILVGNSLFLNGHTKRGWIYEYFLKFKTQPCVEYKSDGACVFLLVYLFKMFLAKLTLLGSISWIPNLSMVSFP